MALVFPAHAIKQLGRFGIIEFRYSDQFRDLADQLRRKRT
jgi:hypothetical protein